MGSTLWTPYIVWKNSGKKQPSATRYVFSDIPMPNRRMNSGSSAIEGIGRTKSTTKRTERYAELLDPMAMPSGTASAIARPRPSAHPSSVRSTDSQNVPVCT